MPTTIEKKKSTIIQLPKWLRLVFDNGCPPNQINGGATFINGDP
jgi:hypothetical protein